MGFPMLHWGTPDDLSGGGYSRSLVSAGAVTGPFGGLSNAYLLTRSAGSDAYCLKTFTPLRSLTYPVTFFVKAGTATASRVSLEQLSPNTAPFMANIAWSGGVPTPTVVAGTLLATISIGGGWYMIRGIATALDMTKSHAYVLRPDTAGSTGTMNAWVGNVAILDAPDDVLGYADDRDGSERVEGTSGVRDAWITGTNHYLQWTARWLPFQDLDDPVSTTGYWGGNETAAVAVGIDAVLTAGRAMSTFYYAPDRSSAATAFAGVYVLAEDVKPSLETNGMYQVPLVLCSTADLRTA